MRLKKYFKKWSNVKRNDIHTKRNYDYERVKDRGGYTLKAIKKKTLTGEKSRVKKSRKF